jgi:nicotinamidase-related amidase
LTHAHPGIRHFAGLAAALAIALGGAHFAAAQTIIDDWAKVQPPPAPTLKPAPVPAKTTALLVLDLVKLGCNNERRPRCVASIPKVKALIAAAQAKGVSVIWTYYPGAKPEDVWPDVAPPAGTKFIVANSDKFLGTDLEKELKDKGITTVIAVGTAAQGAVLYTVSEAALRGFKVVVPVDGVTSESLYLEQAVAQILSVAPGVANNVTLSKMDMISYQ